MFGEIFRFELRQQLRSPLFWLIAIALAAIAFGAASSDSIVIGGGVGNIHRNAPYVVVTMLGFFSIVGLFLITIFVAGAVLRDFHSGTAEMMFSTPVPRMAYLSGRFTAGWLVSVLVLIAVAIGMWLGSLMPWLDAARLGPTPWAAYVWAFAVLILPSLFFLSSLLFLLATVTRSMLGTYIGVIAFLVLWGIASAMLGTGNIDNQTLAALIDPFGIGALDLVTRYWTPSDRNTQIPQLMGVMLGNRALWLGIGAGLLALAYVLFNPEREGLRWFRRRKRVDARPVAATASAPSIALPAAKLQSGLRARFQQFLSLAWFDTRCVLGGVPFLVMLAFGLLNLGGNLTLDGQIVGTVVLPVTHLMAQSMGDSYTVLLVIVVGFYAGELVWRERDGRISEVVDAFPTPDWIPLLSKVTALAAVIVAFLLAGTLLCISYQLMRGFHDVQPLLYLQFLGLDLLGFLLMAILAVVLQVWANNKFVGYGLFVAFLISAIVLSQFHLSDHLYRYGSAPDTPYSDMNGFGTFWIGNLAFRAYWYCFAIALLVTAALYWVRGNVGGWRARGRIAMQRFGVVPRVVLASALVAFVAIGAFNFHNTHRLNRYQSYDEGQRLAAAYEKDYRKYLGVSQPRITDVKVDVAIYPAERAVEVNGRYLLVNKHEQPINELLVQLPVSSARDAKIDLDFPAHTIAHADAAQGFTVYKLTTPLAAGASMDFGFRMRLAYEGFANEPTGQEMVNNGTFINNFGFPHFCYDEGRQLSDNNDRRKYGLGPAQRMPKRDDAAAHADNVGGCDADWVNFEATLSTSADQVALAPGYLQKEWTQGDRRYFHYVQDTPILDFFSFQSARYTVARDQWNDVALEVYHDPRHAYNVDRMIKASKLSLDYYSEHFGPYQFRQFRILEFPN